MTGLSFGAMFFLGLGVTIVGAAARNAGISASQVGVLLTVQNAGFLLSVAVTGGLADRRSRPRMLAVGSVILAIGFAGFYLRDTFWLNVLFMFLVGVGIGSYEGVADALIIVLQPQRKSFYVNLNHFFVTLGSLIITLYLIFLQMSWRLSMTQAAIVVIVLAVLLAFSEEPSKQPGGSPDDSALPQDTAPAQSPSLWRSPALPLLLVAMICAVGLELGAISLLTTYLMDLRGFDQVTSKVGLLLFIGGIGIGRATLAALIRDETVERWVLAFFALSVVTNVLLFTVPVTAVLYVLAPLAGMTVSVLLPSIIALAGKSFPLQAGTAIGLVKLGIPLGGIFLPLLLAIATRIMPLQTALHIFPVTAVVGGAALVYFVVPERVVPERVVRERVVPDRLTHPGFMGRIRR